MEICYKNNMYYFYNNNTINFSNFNIIKYYLNNYLFKLSNEPYFLFDNVHISNFVYNALIMDVYYSSYAYKNIRYISKNTENYLFI